MDIGRYSLGEPLGAGTDGAAYRATDSQTGATVELRVLSAAAADPARFRTISKRLHLAAMLHHSASLAIKDLQLTFDPPHVAMEPGPQSNLAEWIAAGGSLSATEAFSLAQPIVDVLASAHSLGLVHGGLSPSRILCRTRTEWLVDLTGMSCSAVGRSGGRLDSDTAFRAPEQESGGHGDSASDIYSLALILKWLLYGESALRPVLTNTDATLVLPAAPAREMGGASELLSYTLGACLREDPSDRPTAREVGKAMNDIVRRLRADRTTVPSNVDLRDTVVFSAQPSPGSHAPTHKIGAMPEKLGRFRLIEKLGQGGMGAVFKGEDIADGTIVAIKVLSTSYANEPEYRRRFTKEARLLSQVNNPCVANLLEFNDDEGVLYLATEFVAGRSLGGFLNEKGKLDEPTMLAIASDVSRALLEAHKQGIVHRDIKPDNILLVGDNADPGPGAVRAKLTDFGLARHQNQTESLQLTHAGTLLGTPLYMSPEQCRGTDVDARSDIYSLGATLYHMLAGRPPFQSETPIGVLTMHLSEDAPPLTRFAPAVSEATERIITRTLAKLPQDRQQDAEELFLEIERVRRGEPTSLEIHPRLPTKDSRKALTFTYEWELQSSPEKLWNYVANTDRLNRAMGLPAVEFRTSFDPQRGVRKFGQAKAAGITLTWEEHPFEWVEARRMGVLRQFQKGFFKWFISTVDLVPRAAGGTLLRHTFCLEPSNGIGRLVAHVEIGRRTPRALEKLYRQFDQYIAAGELSNPAADPFQSRSTLTDAQKRRLAERLHALTSYGVAPDLIHACGEYLEHAGDQDVARIRPSAFADRFHYDRKAVLKACLAGVRESLLVLLWDILCPRCRIPSDVKEALSAIGDHGHCEACNLDFELDFANSIELVFRAHPEIRNVEVRTYCVGGPAFSTHVVAQTRIAAGERVALDLGLAEGTYRLRGPQLPYQADFRVSPGAQASRWNLDLSRGVTTELAPKLRAGGQRLTFDNPLDRELLVRIERSVSRSDAVTAADASNLALFRELFPDQLLVPGQMASVATVTLLMLQLDGAETLYESVGDGKAFGVIHEAFRGVEEIVRNAGGALIKTYGDQATCSFSEPVAAVRAAFDLASRFAATPTLSGLNIKAAIHRGPAMVANLNDRLDYFGANVRLAQRLLELASPNELLLTQSVVALPDIDDFLVEQQRAPRLVNAIVPGYPREILQRVELSDDQRRTAAATDAAGDSERTSG